MTLKRALACLLALTLLFGVVFPVPEFGIKGMSALAETVSSAQTSTDATVATAVPTDASVLTDDSVPTATLASTTVTNSSVTPTAAPASTDTPVPTNTATPTAAPASTDTPVPTNTATPTAAPVSTDTPAPTNTATPTATAVSTDTPTPTDVPVSPTTAIPTATLSPTDIPDSTNTPTSTIIEVPSATPSLTGTPEADAFTHSPMPEEIGFESGYARLNADESVYAAPSATADVLGVLARDAIVYVSEYVSQHWLKVFFAFEQNGLQMVQGYLQEDRLVPEADQDAAAAAIMSGLYMTCKECGGIALAPVSWMPAEVSREESVVLGDTSEPKSDTAEPRSDSFLDAAEEYYGTNGKINVGTVKVQWLDASKTIKAGQQINLSLAWTLAPAATYNYTQIAQPLFDDYENTRIVLTLPEGVSIVESSAGTLQNVTEVIHENGEWILKLTDHLNAYSSQNGTIIIPLLIEGNGERGIGEQLDFSSPVRLETEFTILDRTHPGQTSDAREYEKTITGAGLDTKTIVTDDRWGIEKEAVSAVPSADKSTVTVTFRLTVGLMGADETINTNSDTYERVGRVPFEGEVVRLTETLSVKDRDGVDIPAQKVTITPQFGAGQPMDVTEDDKINLPVDTCAGKGFSSVAGDAPYWSSYLVEAVYPYEKFIAQFYDEKQDKLTIANTARIDYQLKGGDPDNSQAQASIAAGEVTLPAQITISKYIVNMQGAATLYTAENFPEDQPITGAALFAITVPGGDAAVLYGKQGNTYRQLTGNEITLDPAATGDTNGTDGTFTVYVQPGTYIVSENDVPENTEKITGGVNNAEDKTLSLEAGDQETAGFYNRECLGSITITKLGRKTGASDVLLAGTEFTLYQGEQVVAEGTTDDSGHLRFDRLPFGEYTVKETGVPEGYVDEAYQTTVQVNADQSSCSLEVVNRYNLAPVILQKQMYNGIEYVNVDLNTYGEFENCFTIEQQTGDDSWLAVEGMEALSPNQAGQILALLPVYNDAEQPITYRFREDLPVNWHDPSDASAEKMYSEKFQLVDELGNSTNAAKVITMTNNRNGSFALEKQFYQMSLNGSYEKQPVKEATFTLYRKTQGGTIEKVEERRFTGTTTFVDLLRTDEHNQPYQYYLVETPIVGYVADTSGMVEIELDGEEVLAWGPYTFVAEGQSPARLDQSAVVANYATTLPVVIKKANSITGDFVSGAYFTIAEYDGVTEGQIVVNETLISANGKVVYLEGGKQYTVAESVVPQGYTDVTVAGETVIDLRSYTSLEQTEKYSPITITLKNQPDPKLKVVKRLVSGDDPDMSKTLSGVAFEVYRKTGDSTFERVQNYDGNALTLLSGTATQLPDGTYYLKEIVPSDNPNQILDPNLYPQEYTRKGELEGQDFFFGPVVVPEVTDKSNLTISFTVDNLSSLGTVQATKYALGEDGRKAPLGGAQLSIYRQGETEALQTETSDDETGMVTFTNLPIYDVDRQKITYTICETAAPEGYTLAQEELTVTLEPGQIVTKNEDGLLELVNLPKTSFEVTKVYRKIWEYSFTKKDYRMPGAQIALYEKQADGNYELKEMQTTDEMGMVLFTGLDQTSEYVAVEYNIPNLRQYDYLEPSNGKAYLAADFSEAPPQSLKAEDLDKYYYVTKEENAGNPVLMNFGTLTNEEHWAQLQIEKFVMDPQDDTGAPEGTQAVKRYINNAEFDLYMEVLAKGTDSGALTFDNDNLSKYTFVGSYTSGTLYNAQGERQDGWFATDILQVADHVVYWLVERTGGSGSLINPKNQIILIKREGTEYTNDSTAIQDSQTSCTQVYSYKLDRMTKESVENLPTTGGGGDMFSTVRIVKWAGEVDADGNRVATYTPLGNAAFSLYLVHANGERVALLDTMTTGLDNDLSTGEDLTAWASSQAFSFNTLENIYSAENDPAVEQDIIWRDENGNGYVRVQLVETGIPAGYDNPNEGYGMILYFQYEEGKSTEVFNDAFYIKDADGEQPAADPDEWALYPTKETGAGQYAPIEDVAGSTGQYRIVNWPVDNFSVTVRKYGYSANGQTLGMTSEQLDEYFLTARGRTPLEVTMKLQRYSNGVWKDYAYPSFSGSTATFTTKGGYFAFPKGLGIGRYRIIETGANSDYENIYDGAPLTGDAYYNARAYYFQVTHKNVQITMYNPQKRTLSLRKTDTAGTGLAEATFTLTAKTGAPLTAVTGQDGKAIFSHVGTGIYKLAEINAAPGYSREYLDQYLRSAYATYQYEYGDYRLADFASNGIFLGFETVCRDNQMVVSDIVDLHDYGVKNLTIHIIDPSLCSLKIQKTDRIETDIGLEGATFSVAYKPFSQWSGEEVVDDTGWSTINATYTTDKDGVVLVENLQPGIYKVTETKAPDGYDLSVGAQYVVLTGGLEKTVTLAGNKLENDQPLIFSNAKKVALTVQKKISTGALTVQGAHSFTFELYDSDKKTKLRSQTVSIPNGAADAYTTKAVFDGLSQGKTYYLKETSVPEDFALTAMEGSGGMTVVPDGDFYSFTVPVSNADITVTAVNTYLYAKVTILKVNAENGQPLNGAAFKAYRMNNGNFMRSPSGQWTNNTSGEYSVLLPLTSAEGNTFRIQEFSAPAGYRNDHPFADVTVRPGESRMHEKFDSGTMTGGTTAENDAAMLAKLIYPNYRGSVIEIVKYGNTKESVGAAPLEGATFTLYTLGANQIWQDVGMKTTNAQGRVSFTVESGKTYAVVESTVPQGYDGLQGLYSGESKMPIQTIGDREYHLLNGGYPLKVSTTYQYKAYNRPWVELEIRKQDINNRQTPTAVVNVYEVPDDTPAKLTQKQVAELMRQRTPLLSGIKVQTPSAQGGYSYANKSTNTALGREIVSGKTYLIVETESSMTQLRDNNRVVWYVVHSVPAGATEKQVVTLKNIAGSASQSLKKTTSTTQLESLLTHAATLEYTLTPSVSNTYPLDGYAIEELGLTAYNGTAELDFSAYLKDKYSITQITVGPASHDTSAYWDAPTGSIQATVAFYGFDGALLSSRSVDISSAEQTVYLESTAKARYVKVSYECPAFKKATGYALGQNFVPGVVKVRLALDQQTGGEGVQAITKVSNMARAVMTYRPWDNKGVQKGEQDRKTDTIAATATNLFGDLKTAKIRVTCTANKGTISLDGDVVTYTITLTNVSSAGASMVNPFLVDLLPQGMLLNGTNGNVQLAEAPEGISIENTRTNTSGGETALFVFLSGLLKPGESVKLTLQVKSTSAVAIHGADVDNYVIAGSREKGVQSKDNPRSTSWKTADGAWPPPLEDALSTLDGTERLTALRTMLDDMAGFGYISAGANVAWTASSDAALLKMARGDRSSDIGFTSNRLSTVNNNGYIDYRLILTNLSANYHYTDVTFVDVLPYKGDTTYSNTLRGSAWGMNFDRVTDVTRIDSTGGSGAVEYKVFYYNSPIADAEAVYDAVDVLKYDTVELPNGWSNSPGSTVTAIAIAVRKDESVALASRESYMVQYRMNVGELSQQELQSRAWQNAVNDFACQFSHYIEGDEAGQGINSATPVQPLSSNSVSATILPESVQVGGHVWIDKNVNGVWDDGESVAELNGDAIVNKLLSNVEIRLNSFEGTSSSASNTVSYVKGLEWPSNAKFVFKGLDSADPRESASQSELYSGTVRNNPLDPAWLKGSAPKTYNIVVTIPENSGVMAQVTSLGGGNPNKKTGYSRDPKTLVSGGAYADETRDNNFVKASERSFISERFYLYATSGYYDNSKDIGLILGRNVSLLKKDAVSGAPLAGAEFKLYGPFASVQDAQAAALNDTTLLKTVQTDAQGMASFGTLNWYQVYIIEETAAAPYHNLDGADADNAEGLLTAYEGTGTSRPAWVLGIPGADVTSLNQVIHVTNQPETMDISGKKTWQDANNQDGLRPEEITIHLLANGIETMKKIVTAQDGWAWTFDDLPRYENGAEIVYTIAEDSVQGYNTQIDGFNVINHHTPETINLSGKKTWDDQDDFYGMRPVSITVHLLADGIEKAKKTVTAQDDWTWTFDDLPKYEDGVEIAYTIVEDAVPGYIAEVSGYNITNRYTPNLISISVTKVWEDANDQDGIRPQEITVKLLADGVETGRTLVLNEANSWTGIFDGLDEYSHGRKIVYTVREEAVSGYQLDITGDADTGFVLTNAHEPETMTIAGEKTWDDADDYYGKRPESITIYLLADGMKVDERTVTAESGWKWSFENMPRYKDGEEIIYTVAEAKVEGYTAEVSGYNITNRYTPNLISISVTKVWEDANDQDGIRPQEITVKLLADGVETGRVLVLNEANSWTGIFDGLDEYSHGRKIVYTVREEAVSGYQLDITGDADTGFVLTNAHEPETMTIAGEKTWDDADDYYGKRPESITIYLLADGMKVDERIVTAESGWKWSFENMPRYKDGEEIIYTVAEAKVEGYTAEVSGYDVKNTLMSVEAEIHGEKRVDVSAPWTDFTFVLTAQDTNAPMPGGQSGGTVSVSRSGPGPFSFGSICFVTPGIYRYKVTEEAGNALGYVYDKSEYLVEVTVTQQQDVLSADVAYVKAGSVVRAMVFENLYRTASLTVAKRVTGQGASTTEAFSFTITLMDASGMQLTASYPYTGTGGAPSGMMQNGMMTVSLAHNQSITIDGIPVGATYTVTEAANNAYEVSAASPEGIITENGAVASFVNKRRTYSDVPKTGYGETSTRYAVAGICLMTALLAMVLRRRFRRK